MFPGKPQWDVGRCGWWWWCGWWGEAVVRRSWNSVCVKITISHATFHTCIKPNVEEAHLLIYSEALSHTHTHTHIHIHIHIHTDTARHAHAHIHTHTARHAHTGTHRLGGGVLMPYAR